MSNSRFSIIQARAVTDPRVDDTLLRLLCIYGMYSDKNGWCWPARKTIASFFFHSPAWVTERTDELIMLGYMEKAPRYDEDGGQMSNMYRLLFDTPRQELGEKTDAPRHEVKGETDTNVPLNAPYNTAKPKTASPTAELPIEWQIAAGKEVKQVDDKRSQMLDTANQLGMTFGGKSFLARDIAFAFMVERDIVIPAEKIKGNRKPLKSMIQSGVLPEHIVSAVRKLLASNMTVVDLFSVEKTAVDLANPAERGKKPTVSMETRD